MSEDEQTEDLSPLGLLRSRATSLFGMRNGQVVHGMLTEAADIGRRDQQSKDEEASSSFAKSDSALLAELFSPMMKLLDALDTRPDLNHESAAWMGETRDDIANLLASSSDAIVRHHHDHVRGERDALLVLVAELVQTGGLLSHFSHNLRDAVRGHESPPMSTVLDECTIAANAFRRVSAIADEPVASGRALLLKASMSRAHEDAEHRAHCADLESRLEAAEQARDRVIDEARGLDTEARVRFYEHDFYPLSNFSAFSLLWKGLRFDTSEHVYHWEKFTEDTMLEAHGTDGAFTVPIRALIQVQPSAHQAFKLAERHKTQRRHGWDDVKVDIMREILRAKVEQHEYVRRKLLATTDRELVEDSWRDDFWGWGPNRDGKNMLGKLWMELRAELRGTP